jgi:hypothetical protein
VTLGLTRGEILLVAFIFALVYVAGLLPKIAARLTRSPDDPGTTAGKSKGE